MVRGAERDRAVLSMAERKRRADADEVPQDAASASASEPAATPPAFRYQVSRERALFVFWRGRRVFTATGPAAERLLARLEGADPETKQMVLAKATGNFKRGNERR